MMAKLDSICKMKMGQSPDSSSYNENGKGIPFFQGNADFGAIHPTVRVWCDAPTKIAYEGDILISVRAPIGALNIANIECCIGRGLAALTVDESVCDKRYLWYGIASKVDELNSKGTGSTFKAISKNVLAETEIPLPTIDIQKQIALKLDTVCSLISLRKQQLSKLDELVKSRFIELFGSQCHNEKNYPYGKIDDVAEIYLGLTHTPEYIETGVKFISAKNTSCDYLDLSDVKYISKEEYASAPAGAKPRKGDVLFSRVGSNLGHPVILDIDEELCTFVSLGYLRTKGRVTNLYLKHWMRDDFFAEQVRRKVVGGGQPNLNTGWLKEFRIIIPPMDLQEQFAAFVEQTDKSKLAIQKSLEKLETLKKSLMQKYFG